MFNRIFWGFVLIGLGVFFILNQRGLIEFDIWDIIVTYWPLILIYYGLKGLIFQYRWGHGIGFGYLYPIILTTVGVYFLGSNIDYIEMSAGDFFQYVIPVILILIGIIIILKPGKKSSESAKQRTEGTEPPFAEGCSSYHHEVPRSGLDRFETEETGMASPGNLNGRETDESGKSRKDQDVSQKLEDLEPGDLNLDDLKLEDLDLDDLKERATKSADSTFKDPIPMLPGEAFEDHSKDFRSQNYSGSHHGGHHRAHQHHTHGHYDHQQHGGNHHFEETEFKPENHFSFIGDINIGSANWQLKPLNINNCFGDIVIDLTRADIPDGVTKITIGLLIGDIHIMLPEDPDVEASVTMSAFIGDFDVYGKTEGGMMRNYREESPNYLLARKKIQIMANMFIGDFRIERL